MGFGYRRTNLLMTSIGWRGSVVNSLVRDQFGIILSIIFGFHISYHDAKLHDTGFISQHTQQIPVVSHLLPLGNDGKRGCLDTSSRPSDVCAWCPQPTYRPSTQLSSTLLLLYPINCHFLDDWAMFNSDPDTDVVNIDTT